MLRKHNNEEKLTNELVEHTCRDAKALFAKGKQRGYLCMFYESVCVYKIYMYLRVYIHIYISSFVYMYIMFQKCMSGYNLYVHVCICVSLFM